jgi:hypothetical protein
MKSLAVILTIIALTCLMIGLMSCSSGSGNRVTEQVEYVTGEVTRVGNPLPLAVKPGDTVIIERYVSIDKTDVYATNKIWGRYKGTLPNEDEGTYTDWSYRQWYQIAVVQ